MNQWRLIIDGHRHPGENMALDEAVLRSHRDTGFRTFRLFMWKPSAISIGYFQGLEQEVDIEACRRNDVLAVRRITGGGAVYHDEFGEVTYSVVLPDDDPLISGMTVLESYDVLCKGVINGLEMLGLDAGFRPVNDIIVNERKISGNAQTRRSGGVLQHGTILTNVDVDLMFSLLKVPDEKMRDKLISNVKERVTSITHELGTTPNEKVKEVLVDGFQTALDADWTETGFTSEELELAETLRNERYGNPEWTGRR